MSINQKKVAILATNGFEQVELMEPQKALGEAGVTTHIVALESGSIRAWDEDDWGDSVAVDRTVDDVAVEEYDALVLPGGVINPDHLRRDDTAVEFVRAFVNSGKPVAAICHGPWILAEADVLRGRRLTSFSSIATDMKNAGAEWVDEEVVTDGNLITSRNPDDLPAFIDAIRGVLSS